MNNKKNILYHNGINTNKLKINSDESFENEFANDEDYQFNLNQLRLEKKQNSKTKSNKPNLKGKTAK